MVNLNVVDLIISSTWAQDAANTAAPAAQQPSPFASFFPIILMFVVFYFLLFRPQKKKMQEEQSLLSSLKLGDEIYTKSGLLGTIAGLNEKLVTLEVAEGVKVKVLRGQIAGMTKKLFEAKAEKATGDDKLTLAKNGKKK